MRAATVFLVVLLTGAANAAPSEADLKQEMMDALMEANEIPAQAEVLARLAWLDDSVEPLLATMARNRLVNYGEHGIHAARTAIRRAAPDKQGDIVQVIIAARERLTSGFPREYLPALEEAIWYGSREARELAIPEVSRFRARACLLPMIDAAIEDPELLPVTLEALGNLGDDRARFFLREMLRGDDPELARAAAAAMAKIGGNALEFLREGVYSETPHVRMASVEAVLTVAGIDDLSTLYEYYGSFPDDDAALRDRVRETALRLEEILEAHRAHLAASPTPDH